MGTPTYPSEMLICNQSLAACGSTQQISSFQDGSNEALQCALWYPSIRDAILADFPWPWAEGYLILAEVAGPETNGLRANAQWTRSYRFPVDCAKLVRVVRTPPPLMPQSPPQTTGVFGINYWYNQTWRRALGDAYPVSYGLSQDAVGKLICSDFYGAYGLTAIYTMNSSDPTQWDADFSDSLMWRLGGRLARTLMFNEKKAKDCDAEYKDSIKKSRATAMNQIQGDTPYIQRQAEVIRRRFSRI